MTGAPKKPMGAHDFFRWLHRPSNADNQWELERGRVVREHRHDKQYYLVSHHIGNLLFKHFQRLSKGHCVACGTAIRVRSNPATVRKVPVAVYETNEEFDELERGFAERPPLMAVEIEEQGKSYGVLALRTSELLHMGVPLVWLAHPKECSVTVYPSGKTLYVIDSHEEMRGEGVLSKFRCRVADLFPPSAKMVANGR